VYFSSNNSMKNKEQSKRSLITTWFGRNSKPTMIMKKIFTFFFDIWWIPIMFFSLTLGISMVSEMVKNEFFWFISSKLFMCGFYGLLISSAYQVIKKRRFAAVLQGIIFISFFFFCLLYSISEFLRGWYR